MRVFLLTLAALGLLVRGASGAPLDPKQVAANAQWVVHVDFDAMRGSRIGKFVREKCLSDEHVQQRLKKIQADTGINPKEDPHNLTLYGSRFAKDNGVAILRASHLDHQKLLDKLKEKHPDYKTDHHGDDVLYTWTERAGKSHERQVSGAFHGEDTLLFASDKQQLIAALEVLEDKAPSLAANSPLAAVPPAGAFVVVRGIDMNRQSTPFHSDVISKSKRLSVAVGEHGDEVFTQGVLVAADADTAVRVREVVEGFRALAQLRLHSNQTAVAVLDGLRIAAAENTVSLEWLAPGEDIMKLLAEQHERMLRHFAAKHAADDGHKAGDGHEQHDKQKQREHDGHSEHDHQD